LALADTDPGAAKAEVRAKTTQRVFRIGVIAISLVSATTPPRILGNHRDARGRPLTLVSLQVSNPAYPGENV
jgi:hypothetical protein